MLPTERKPTVRSVRIADMKLSFIRRDALSARPVERQDADNGLLYNVTTQRKSSFMTFVKELFYINKINPFSILPLQYDETVPQYAFLNPYAYYLLYEWQQESHHLYIWLYLHVFSSYPDYRKYSLQP